MTNTEQYTAESIWQAQCYAAVQAARHNRERMPAMTTAERTIVAANLTAGDEVFTQYYDASGMYQTTYAPVLSVRTYTRTVRVTFGDGWGQHSYPADKPMIVKA